MKTKKAVIFTALILASACLCLAVGVSRSRDVPHVGEGEDASAAVFLDTSGEPLSEDDKSLISWLVACEAGGYPYMTQVCVAAVILNRLETDGFPDTARGLIFESGDFMSVYRGLVTGSPTEAQRSTKKYRLGRMALEEALGGSDPTGGALYYADGADVHASVANSYECGGMIFGY